MILARKLDLQQSLRRALVTIEDKELALHFHNNQRLGLISAMLAIFIFGAFYGRYLPQNSLAEKASSEYAEIAVPTSELGAGHVVLLHAYMALTAAATILQLLVVVRTTMLCVLAPGLGLRGPEGSMTRAVLVLRRQSMINLHLFYAGYVCFCADAAVYLYILFEGDAVLPAPSLALIAASLVWAAVDATRVERRLRLPLAGGFEAVPPLPDPRSGRWRERLAARRRPGRGGDAQPPAGGGGGGAGAGGGGAWRGRRREGGCETSAAPPAGRRTSER